MKLHKPRTYYRMFKVLLKGPLVLLEPDVFKTVRRMRGRRFVDIGANVGLYTFLLQSRFKRIWAFEPNPEVFAQLKKDACHYPHITISPLALSDHNGETMLYLNKEEARCSGSADTIMPVFYYRPASSPATNRATWERDGVMVKTARYDDCFQIPVDLVKVDVEGAEFLVLEGMRNNLTTRNVKNIVVELHDRTRANQLVDLFKTYGYMVRWLDQDHAFAWTR